MSQAGTPDMSAWRKKAVAFATRSHRHLWGKNNSDPLAFLFHQGISNPFAKRMVLGWNKFTQQRPRDSWGLALDADRSRTFLIPAGIVVPMIWKKTLHAIFIQTYDDSGPQEVFMLPGSCEATLALGDPGSRILVLNRLMDGLFLFQEKGGSSGIVIHPLPDRPLTKTARYRLKNAGSVLYLKNEQDTVDPPGLMHTSAPEIRSYSSRSDLISKTADL